MADAPATRRSSRFSMRSRQIGQLLVDSGDLTADQVSDVLKLQTANGGLFGQIARDRGMCTDSAVSTALLKQVQVTDVRCDDLSVDEAVSGLIDRTLCETEKLCPFEKLGNMLCIVMGNPLNRRAITQIENGTHLKVKSFKSIWPKINELIVRTYSGEGGGQPRASFTSRSPETSVQENSRYNSSLQLEDAVAPIELVESTPVQKTVAAGGRARRRSQVAQPVAEARIQGLDTLHSNQAEMVETNRRGLVKRATRLIDAPVSAKPKAEKKAVVNVDLDALDLSQGEVVSSPEDAPEGMDEIQATPFVNKPLLRHADAIVALTAISDDAFYAGGKCPELAEGEVDEKLEALIESLPLAEIVAQSIGEYEANLAGVQSPPPPAVAVTQRQSRIAKAKTTVQPRALELQPSPTGVMEAVAISDAEFQKLTATMCEDPVGEWDWNFSSQGPIPVLAYEEN